MSLNSLEIHTDGGCLGNPGPGGWAFVISNNNNILQKAGSEKFTTNNKMELRAVIEAVKFIVSNNEYLNIDADIYTDSKYVKNGITVWINNWIKNGWKTAQKKPVKNKELWIELKEWSDKKNIRWHWEPGHSDSEFNNMCHDLVQEEIGKINNI